MSELRVYRITAVSDHEDAESILTAAVEELVCALDWQGDRVTEVELVRETPEGPKWVAGWFAEPGGLDD